MMMPSKQRISTLRALFGVQYELLLGPGAASGNHCMRGSN
jgi:hypothetical protein